MTLAYNLISLGKEIVKLTDTVPKLEEAQREGEFEQGASMVHGQEIQESDIREQLAKDILQKPSPEQEAILRRYAGEKVGGGGDGRGMGLVLVAALIIYAISQ